MNKEKLTSASALGTALVTAVLPLACCWGPTLFAGIAVLSGFATEMAWLHPYEPYLYAVSFTALGYSHYKSYKLGQSQEDCDRCDTDDSSLPRVNRYTRIILWLATSMVVGMFLLNQFPEWFV